MTFKKTFLIGIIAIIMIGCSGEWHLKQAYKKGILSNDTITKTQIDTVYFDTTVTVEIPADSAFIVDSVYCDSLNNVVIQRLREVSGDRTKIAAELKNGKIFTSAIVESYEREIQVKDSLLFEYERQIINNGLAEDYANFEIAKLQEKVKIAKSKESKWKAQKTWGIVSLVALIILIVAGVTKYLKLW